MTRPFRPLALALLVHAAGLQAQQYNIRTFGIEDGLPGSTVQAIAQDSAGFLWVDTDGGLCRFDGRTFRVWSPGDPAPTLRTDELLQRPDGRPGLFRRPLSTMSIAALRGLRNSTCELADGPDAPYWVGGPDGAAMYPTPMAPRPTA